MLSPSATEPEVSALSGNAPSRGFAETWWDFHRVKSAWEDDFFDLLADDEEYEHLGTDSYDCSLEIRGASNDWRLSGAQQQFLFDAGFFKIYVNHNNGWETHYTHRPDGQIPVRGWRRRYVDDPTAATTNVIVGPENNGYFEISFWPTGWNSPGSAKWLETGYMRIVPDPLDSFRDSDGSPEGQDA